MRKIELSVQAEEWRALGDLLPRVTPSVTSWRWLTYHWIIWHFFPCGLHSAWFSVPLIKCKEPSRDVRAQEPAGETRNSITLVFSSWNTDTTSCLEKKKQQVDWLACVLYLTQKAQIRVSTKSGVRCYWVVTPRSEACQNLSYFLLFFIFLTHLGMLVIFMWRSSCPETGFQVHRS